MKYAVIFALVTSPAFAGGYVAPITQLPPVPVQVKAQHDWSGAYVGLSYGRGQREKTRIIHNKEDVIEHRQETRPFTKRDLHEHLQTAGCEPGQKFFVFNDSFSGKVACESVRNNTPDAGWDTLNVRGFDPVITREWDEVVGEEWTSSTITQRESGHSYGAFAGYRRQLQGGAVLGLEASYGRSVDEDSIRASAQIGYALDRFLPYVTAGYDFASEEAFYGAGADYAVTNSVFVGALYTKAEDEKRAEVRLGLRF